MRKLTDEDIKEINYLYRNGLSYRKIGKRYNVSGTTIWRKINKNKEEEDTKVAIGLSLIILPTVLFVVSISDKMVFSPIFWAGAIMWCVGVLLTFFAGIRG